MTIGGSDKLHPKLFTLRSAGVQTLLFSASLLLLLLLLMPRLFNAVFGGGESGPCLGTSGMISR